MGWNESGDQKPKDPWGREKKQAGGPPDLDALLKQFGDKFFKSKKKTSGNQGGQQGGIWQSSKWLILIIVLVLLLIWVIAGIFIVAPAERSVVLRFGRYQQTVGPGPHWLPPLIEKQYKVNVQRVDSYSYSAEMLTKDENIVSVAVAVQYRVANAREFLFNVKSPIDSLQQATASALRQVVGHTTLDAILTTGREQVRDMVEKQLQGLLSRYQSGIVVTDVTLQPAKPPEQVTDAFDDAIKAREDEQTYINRATAYQRKITATVQGQMARILQRADAGKQELIEHAKAEIAPFLALLPAYKAQPALTRERLYLSTMQAVLQHSSKVLLDHKGSNLLYVPLAQLLKASTSASSSSAQAEKAASAALPSANDERLAEPLGAEFSSNRPSYPSREGS